jgi:integrase
VQTITGKNKRAIGDIDDPTKEELYAGISKIKEPYRSYIALLYLTGNRVSEVLGTPKNEKERNNKEDFTIEPLKVYHIEVTPEENMIRITARTLKRKGRPQHTYVCRIDTPEEKRYYEFIKEHLSTKQPEDYAWNFSRYKAWRTCNKATGLPPHKLRGLRATRDAVEFELDAIDLKNKYNWSSPNMAFHYASKSSHDIERKLLRKN